tara:strand:- start:870 stop:2024 length:1155 start_codon:yes stop_codon:yes gene_type:complete
MIKNTESLIHINPDHITQYFIDKGFVRVEPNMIIPADTVVNHMGEDIRRRLLIAPSPDGREHCLRPDFTLPLVLESIKNTDRSPKRYVYDGFAFRFPTSKEISRKSPEFRQIGIEDFGSRDLIETDVSVLNHALQVLGKVNFSDYDLLLGDVSIFYSILDKINISLSYKDRIKRLFWRGANDIIPNLNIDPHEVTSLNKNTLDKIKNNKNDYNAKDLIGNIAGFDKLHVFGGRDPENIINNYIEKKEIIDTQIIDKNTSSMLSNFLSINCSAILASETLTSFAKSYNLDLDQEIESLDKRFKLLNEGKPFLDSARFQTSLGRRVEYYTGLIFEIRSNKMKDLGPIAIGGRYDNFFTDLGSPVKVPAVGCSVYVDRLLMAGDKYV